MGFDQSSVDFPASAARDDQDSPIGMRAGADLNAILQIVIELDDIEHLEQICCGLPEGCGLHVKIGLARSDHCEYEIAGTGNSGAVPYSFDPLTAMQRDIAQLHTQDLSNKDIDRRLALSHFTVRNHISQLFRILSDWSRDISEAEYLDLVGPPDHEALRTKHTGLHWMLKWRGELGRTKD